MLGICDGLSASLKPEWLLKVIVLGNLVTVLVLGHTRFTYHRTWETGLEVAAEPPLLTPNFFGQNVRNLHLQTGTMSKTSQCETLKLLNLETPTR